MDIDRAVQHLGGLVAVHRVEQLVAREDAPAGAQDRAEEPELHARQIDDRAVVATHLVARGIDGQVAVAEDGLVRRAAGASAAVAVGAIDVALRRRIDFTRSTSSAGENGLGR